jgi:hypothetical protein
MNRNHAGQPEGFTNLEISLPSILLAKAKILETRGDENGEILSGGGCPTCFCVLLPSPQRSIFHVESVEMQLIRESLRSRISCKANTSSHQAQGMKPLHVFLF